MSQYCDVVLTCIVHLLPAVSSVIVGWQNTSQSQQGNVRLHAFPIPYGDALDSNGATVHEAFAEALP